jgi:hypothetical protein
MATLFQGILERGMREGHLPNRSKAARDWYRNQASEIKKVNENSFMKSDVSRLRTQISPGNLYAFYYDPKHKETLPYYDMFPLIFPYLKTDDGFMGINLHYLPLTLRAKLMDALYDTANNSKFDQSTKLKFNYQILTSASKYKYFKPCIKRYLTEHVRSRFLYIEPAEWDIAMALPLQRFVKKSGAMVWNDSRKLIAGT